ncbi:MULTISPECIES: hypothetical protein [Paenibacillus]|uniref:hypothetical protein n=1 Tax=Paenibacillus TaxID=44249 RepID=UPI0003901B50|nr:MULTISPECIES: hypothetical protein [Paenibacillus]CDN42014.1 hypothetical protein BN871_AT_00160 [Paenibacillus sp. P22]
MTLVTAIHAASRGHAIISAITDRRITPDMLAPITLMGPAAAAHRSVEMTKAEREGEWEICITS